MIWSWRNSPAVILAAVVFAAAPSSAGAASALNPAELQEMETLLRDLGFNPGKVDGTVDENTVAAIRRYQDFAVLPDEPEPSAKLLDELRGVAAAFAALNATEETTATSAPETPDLGAGAPETIEPPAPQNTRPQPAADKVIVPPPPAPHKLVPADDPPETAVANTPPVPGVETEPGPDPADEVPARIAAELAPHRADLASGAVTHDALARRFNGAGRQSLQSARYDEAVLRFSVAIHLNPDFAGAYSNRGTAYRHLERTDLAAADFAKAKELGFGGLRSRDGSNPFN